MHVDNFFFMENDEKNMDRFDWKQDVPQMILRKHINRAYVYFLVWDVHVRAIKQMVMSI